MAEEDCCGPAPPEIKGECTSEFRAYIPGKIKKITFNLNYESKDKKK